MEDKVLDQFLYYLSHQDEFVNLYNGKVIVMQNHQVVGVYENEHDAYWGSVDRLEPGTYMIQLCTPGRDAYSTKAHHRYQSSKL